MSIRLFVQFTVIRPGFVQQRPPPAKNERFESAGFARAAPPSSVRVGLPTHREYQGHFSLLFFEKLYNKAFFAPYLCQIGLNFSDWRQCQLRRKTFRRWLLQSLKVCYKMKCFWRWSHHVLYFLSGRFVLKKIRENAESSWIAISVQSIY